MEKEIVDIFDVTYEGAGVGKIDGQVIFVPKALPNETVEVEVVKKTNSFLVGSLVGVKNASEFRTDAICPYFSFCGGCDFQDCEYEYEQNLKKQILTKELAKIGFLGNIEFEKSENRFGYRNKIKLEVRDGKVGYFKAKSHDFFAVENCPVATEKINECIKILPNYIVENDLQSAQSVYIKQVDSSLGVCFLFDKNDKKMLKKMKEVEKNKLFSLFFAFGDVLESNKTQVFSVYGQKKFSKNYGNFSAVVEMSAFNQINDKVAQKLYDYVLSFVSGKRVINAYSGQGLLTFFISQTAKFVYGIEYQRSAHEVAEKLKNLQPNYTIENICGKVEDCLSGILMRDRIDQIVLDPAREGCQKQVLEEIVKSDIKQVIYISCNFSTLVRDLKVLQEKYAVESVKVFDMFPCTCNMETVAVLQRKTDI